MVLVDDLLPSGERVIIRRHADCTPVVLTVRVTSQWDDDTMTVRESDFAKFTAMMQSALAQSKG